MPSRPILLRLKLTGTFIVLAGAAFIVFPLLRLQGIVTKCSLTRQDNGVTLTAGSKTTFDGEFKLNLSPGCQAALIGGSPLLSVPSQKANNIGVSQFMQTVTLNPLGGPGSLQISLQEIFGQQLVGTKNTYIFSYAPPVPPSKCSLTRQDNGVTLTAGSKTTFDGEFKLNLSPGCQASLIGGSPLLSVPSQKANNIGVSQFMQTVTLNPLGDPGSLQISLQEIFGQQLVGTKDSYIFSYAPPAACTPKDNKTDEPLPTLPDSIKIRPGDLDPGTNIYEISLPDMGKCTVNVYKGAAATPLPDNAAEVPGGNNINVSGAPGIVNAHVLNKGSPGDVTIGFSEKKVANAFLLADDVPGEKKVKVEFAPVPPPGPRPVDAPDPCPVKGPDGAVITPGTPADPTKIPDGTKLTIENGANCAPGWYNAANTRITFGKGAGTPGDDNVQVERSADGRILTFSLSNPNNDGNIWMGVLLTDALPVGFVPTSPFTAFVPTPIPSEKLYPITVTSKAPKPADKPAPPAGPCKVNGLDDTKPNPVTIDDPKGIVATFTMGECEPIFLDGTALSEALGFNEGDSRTMDAFTVTRLANTPDGKEQVRITAKNNPTTDGIIHFRGGVNDFALSAIPSTGYCCQLKGQECVLIDDKYVDIPPGVFPQDFCQETFGAVVGGIGPEGEWHAGREQNVKLKCDEQCMGVGSCCEPGASGNKGQCVANTNSINCAAHNGKFFLTNNFDQQMADGDTCTLAAARNCAPLQKKFYCNPGDGNGVPAVCKQVQQQAGGKFPAPVAPFYDPYVTTLQGCQQNCGPFYCVYQPDATNPLFRKCINAPIPIPQVPNLCTDDPAESVDQGNANKNVTPPILIPDYCSERITDAALSVIMQQGRLQLGQNAQVAQNPQVPQLPLQFLQGQFLGFQNQQLGQFFNQNQQIPQVPFQNQQAAQFANQNQIAFYMSKL